MTNTAWQATRRPRRHWVLVTLWSLVQLILLAVAPTAWGQTVDNSFLYFLDGDAAAVTADIATLTQPGRFTSSYSVIGDLSASQRQTLANSAARAVGKTAEIGGGNSITWSQISPLFNGASPPDVSSASARQTLAGQILANVGINWQTPDAFPQAAEAQPTSAGGYVFWGQDIETVGGQAGVDEGAAYMALMWAGRVLLGSSMKIIPVPASGIQKRTAAAWNMTNVLNGVSGGDNYLSALGLADTLSPTDRQNLASIDLLSAMRLTTVTDAGNTTSPLIDGFLAQQYSARGNAVNPGALPGHFSDDMFYPQDANGDPTATSTLLFYDKTMPYAMLSSEPLQLGPIGQPSPAWESSYDGSLPFHAGVYWDAAVDPQLDPRLYLNPTQRSLGDQVPSVALSVPEPSGLALTAAALVGWATWLASRQPRRRVSGGKSTDGALVVR